MLRMLRSALALLLLPISSGADVFDDGQIHDVDFAIGTPSFVRDDGGGAPTTVNLIAGASGHEIQIEDASVLNVFDGATIQFPDYTLASRGAVCGGSLTQLDVVGSADVEVSGGTFTNGPSQPVRTTGGTLVIQGGSFENTASLATKVALSLGGGTAEVRGGTIVDGAVSIGPTVQATLSGGSLGSDGITTVSGGSLTIVGTSFNLPFGAIVGAYNGPLTGTLADGSALTTTLVKGASSPVELVHGTQGPPTSAVCSLAPQVPLLPTWAAALAGVSLGGAGAALLGARLRRL